MTALTTNSAHIFLSGEGGQNKNSVRLSTLRDKLDAQSLVEEVQATYAFLPFHSAWIQDPQVIQTC